MECAEPGECILEGRGTRYVDVRREIAKQAEALPPEMQERVIRFVASLAGSAPKGERCARSHPLSTPFRHGR